MTTENSPPECCAAPSLGGPDAMTPLPPTRTISDKSDATPHDATTWVTGVVTDPPLPEPPIVNVLQGNAPCHPLAIHDRYPPIGTKQPKEPAP